MAVPPKRRHLLVVIGSISGVLALAFLIPWLLHTLHTVSTDDAYVNSHVTFVAPRVAGQVAQVLVDDNNRVREGQTLGQLDPEPFRVQVAIKQASLDTARADLAVAQANVRGLLAQARSDRFKLTRAIEDMDNRVALIRQRAAAWEQSKATLVLAQADFDRAKDLLAKKVISTEEYDHKHEALDVAKAGVTQTTKQMALQALSNLRGAQALSLSYFDCFFSFALAGCALALLAPWMRRSVLAKSEHAAAE